MSWFNRSDTPLSLQTLFTKDKSVQNNDPSRLNFPLFAFGKHPSNKALDSNFLPMTFAKSCLDNKPCRVWSASFVCCL